VLSDNDSPTRVPRLAGTCQELGGTARNTRTDGIQEEAVATVEDQVTQTDRMSNLGRGLGVDAVGLPRAGARTAAAGAAAAGAAVADRAAIGIAHPDRPAMVIPKRIGRLESIGWFERTSAAAAASRARPD
jgi:hypothetical protein